VRNLGRLRAARRRGQILGYNNTTFEARIQNLPATNFSKFRSQKTVTLHRPFMKLVQHSSVRRPAPDPPPPGAGRQTKKSALKDGLFRTRSGISPVWRRPNS